MCGGADEDFDRDLTSPGGTSLDMLGRDDTRSDETIFVGERRQRAKRNRSLRSPCGNIRVGMLFMKKLKDEIQFDDLASATSEFRWLDPVQYRRHSGEVRLVAGASAELSRYANANCLHPLGVVILDEHGRRSDILIRSSITAENSEAAMALLHQHADFWCMDQQPRT